MVIDPLSKVIFLWVWGLLVGMWSGVREMVEEGVKKGREVWKRTWDEEKLKRWVWERRGEVLAAVATVVLLWAVEWFEMEVWEGWNEEGGGGGGGTDEPLYVVRMCWADGMSKLNCESCE